MYFINMALRSWKVVYWFLYIVRSFQGQAGSSTMATIAAFFRLEIGLIPNSSKFFITSDSKLSLESKLGKSVKCTNKPVRFWFVNLIVNLELSLNCSPNCKLYKSTSLLLFGEHCQTIEPPNFPANVFSMVKKKYSRQMDQLGLIDSVSEAQLGSMQNSIYENFFLPLLRRRRSFANLKRLSWRRMRNRLVLDFATTNKTEKKEELERLSRQEKRGTESKE